MRELPMFPLGLALVPGAVLPLHIFEPRYRALVHDCLADEADFGVVLIERGSEVGGGEVRSTVGTVAHIVDGHAFEDGRYALMCVGTDRVRVREWLADDPYPRALVEEWPDAPGSVEPALMARVDGRLRDLLSRRDPDGGAVSVPELDPDPTVASFQTVVVAGLGPFDTQRALLCPDAPARYRLLESVLEEQITLRDLDPGT